MNLIIDPEFRDLIPPLAPQELEQLHKSLSADGCRDPLIVWKGEDILVDGHNRYAYLKPREAEMRERGFEIPVIERRFTSRQAVKNFIILNQLGRRNVDPDTASMLRGMLYNGSKKEHGERGSKKIDQSDPSSTAEVVAKQTGVSAPTVKRDGKFAEALEKVGMNITEFKASGKSRKDIVAEAFPSTKPKAKTLTPKEASRLAELEAVIENAIAENPEAFEDMGDELEPVVVDGTKLHYDPVDMSEPLFAAIKENMPDVTPEPVFHAIERLIYALIKRQCTATFITSLANSVLVIEKEKKPNQ